jgi:hypothetical protein
LSPEFGSIKNIYKVFVAIFPEHQSSISYQKFLQIFNEYDISIRPLKIDVCSCCDALDCKIRAFSRLKNFEQIRSLKNSKSAHLLEADSFYRKLINLKSNLINDKTQAILSLDFQKNYQLPDTKINIEYYLRKISIQNFCIYDEKTFSATLFPYAEHFAMKGANEVISSIDFYLKNIMNSEVKVLHVFCDNCFGQNKNKFLWCYFQTVVERGLYNEVIIYYPIVGHSRLSCDRAFTLIERKYKTIEKIYSPNDYINIIKNSSEKNPFKIVYLNFPLTDNLQPDNNPIAKVYDYKKCFKNILKNKLEYCSDVRIIRIRPKNCEISLTLNEPKFLSITLFKKDFNIELLDEKLKSIALAFDKLLPITSEKLKDVNKLINSYELPNTVTFYQHLYSDVKASNVCKSKRRLYQHMNLNKTLLI